MPTLGRMLTGTLAVLVVMACTVNGSAQMTTQRVNITLTCPQNMESETLAVNVTIAPWIRTAAAGDTISWHLVVAGPGSGSAAFTVSSTDWPLPQPTYTGDGRIEVAVPEDAEDGDSSYDITLDCNGTTILIDPGMRLG